MPFIEEGHSEFLTTATASGFATVTTSGLHLYADGTSGLDTNDGFTIGTPKKTLQATLDLVPDILRHDVAVHCEGTFSEQGNAYVVCKQLKGVSSGVRLVIDGGTNVTVVDDNTGSNYTATDPETDATQIGASGAGWTPDEFRGYWVEVLSGPATGEIRTIQSNTADELITTYDFSTDPLVGATFRIVRPATTWDASTTFSSIYAQDIASGTVVVQNFSLTGTRSSIRFLNVTYGWVDGIIQTDAGSESTSEFTGMGGGSGVAYVRINPDTFDFELTYRGASFRSSPVIIRSFTGAAFFYDSVFSNVTVQNMHGKFVGSSFQQLSVSDVTDDISVGRYFFPSQSGWRACKLGGNVSGSCLTAVHSDISVEDSIDISDSGGSAIELIYSRLLPDGVITGSGNGGAGIYIHSGSIVDLTAGAIPLLSGTDGEITFDGAVENATWSGVVNSGTNFVVTDELSMIKVV